MQVSPQSIKLKRYLKFPMVILLINAGLQSGLSITMLKLLGEGIQQGEFVEYIGLFLIIGFSEFVSVPSMVHSLNLAMKYFDQLQVMPIFMTTVMVLWICSGLMILQESKNYSWGQLFSIYAAFIICCVGVKILMSKIKVQKLRRWRERANSVQSIEEHSLYISGTHAHVLNESMSGLDGEYLKSSS